MQTLAIALAAMLWGGDLLLRPPLLAWGWSAGRVVLGEHLLLTLAFGRILWSGRRLLTGLTARQWGALLFVAWGGSAIATWLYTVSFGLGSPLTAILLQKTQPIFALLLASRFLGERRGPGFWVGCAGALAGALLLTGITHPPAWGDLRWRQAGCALGAAALWGGATVAGRSLTTVLPPALLTGARFALAVPVLAALALLPGHASGAGVNTMTHGPSPWVYLLLIVLLPDLLGMRLYYAGLRGTMASVATLAELCYPLTALLIGLLIQHAHLTTGQWIGLALLLASVLRLSARPEVAEESAPAPIAQAVY